MGNLYRLLCVIWLRHFKIFYEHIMSYYYSNISTQEPWLTTTLSILEIIKSYFTYRLYYVSFQSHSVHFLSLCIRCVSPVWCNNFHFVCSTPIFLPLTRKPGVTKPTDVSTWSRQSFVCLCHSAPKTSCFSDHLWTQLSLSFKLSKAAFYASSVAKWRAWTSPNAEFPP